MSNFRFKYRYYVELSREYICYDLDNERIKEIPTNLKRFY